MYIIHVAAEYCMAKGTFNSVIDVITVAFVQLL